MRNLATIQKIEALFPIKGADRIEVATMQGLGWECIVKKGEFKIGDFVIYIEIDSILPDKSEYEFMRSRKFRVRTIKLKGQVSQGLIIPINSVRLNHIKVGKDVTELLGIVKYDPELAEEMKQSEGKKKSLKWKMMHHRFTRWLMGFKFIYDLISTEPGWPGWVSKTDEERIQKMPQVLERYKDSTVYITEKVDGQSATYTRNKKKFIIASRNKVNTNPSSNYGRIAEKYKLKKIFKSVFSSHTVLQGEIIGPKIQGNKYKLTEQMFMAYNLIGSDSTFIHYNYFSKELKRYNIPSVPFIKECKISDIGLTVADWVQFSKGVSRLDPDTPREGIVVRIVENGKKVLSFKVINPDFLLKYNL